MWNVVHNRSGHVLPRYSSPCLSYFFEMLNAWNSTTYTYTWLVEYPGGIVGKIPSLAFVFQRRISNETYVKEGEGLLLTYTIRVCLSLVAFWWIKKQNIPCRAGPRLLRPICNDNNSLNKISRGSFQKQTLQQTDNKAPRGQIQVNGKCTV